MAARTFTSREFNREPGRIQRAAAEGLIVITERGKPIMAVLPYVTYESLRSGSGSILDALDMDGVGEIEVDFTRPRTLPRAATFD